MPNKSKCTIGRLHGLRIALSTCDSISGGYLVHYKSEDDFVLLRRSELFHKINNSPGTHVIGEKDVSSCELYRPPAGVRAILPLFGARLSTCFQSLQARPPRHTGSISRIFDRSLAILPLCLQKIKSGLLVTSQIQVSTPADWT